MANGSKNQANNVSEHIDLLIFTAIKATRKNSKRPDDLAILKQVIKTQATNFTLKYVEDKIQILIEDGRWSKIRQLLSEIHSN